MKKRRRTPKKQQRGKKDDGQGQSVFSNIACIVLPNKMKKCSPSSHHGQTVVSSTLYGGLLLAAVKGFGRGDPSHSSTFIFYLDTLSPPPSSSL